MRVGLLGGSFNPAHEGHLYVSVEALRRLALDQVWWLVSPQNPLKPSKGMAPFAERLQSARRVARHPRIRVLDLEQRLGTRYSFDTLRCLQRRSDHRFVWLAGADNLAQVPKWYRWVDFLGAVPIAIFAREPYSYEALAGQAARRFARWRRSERDAKGLSMADPPAWVFVRLRPHPASSTRIRELSGGEGRRGLRAGTKGRSTQP